MLVIRVLRLIRECGASAYIVSPAAHLGALVAGISGCAESYRYSDGGPAPVERDAGHALRDTTENVGVVAVHPLLTGMSDERHGG